MSDFQTYKEKAVNPNNSATTELRKEYHSPEFKKLGSVSDLTHSNAPINGASDGAAVNLYVS